VRLDTLNAVAEDPQASLAGLAHREEKVGVTQKLTSKATAALPETGRSFMAVRVPALG
jgi:hypothetical protein